jgi:signal transduction histidine kinase
MKPIPVRIDDPKAIFFIAFISMSFLLQPRSLFAADLHSFNLTLEPWSASLILGSLLAFVLYVLKRDRKNREKLYEIEMKLLTVVENAPIILCEIDPQGIITLSVGKGLEAVGIRSGSSIGRSIFDLYADNASILDKVRKAMSGEVASGPIRIGEYVMEAIYKPVKGEDGQVKKIIGIALDVTSREKAELGLADKSVLLNSLLDSMSEGVVAASIDGKMLFFNRAAEKITGMGATEGSIDKWMSEYGVFYEDGTTPCPPEKNPMALALRGEDPNDVGLFLRNSNVPKGIYLSVNGRALRDEHGKIQGGMVVFRDVTEEKRAEEHSKKYMKKLEESNRDLNDFIFVASHDLQEPLRKIQSYGNFLKDEAGASLSPTASDYLTRIQGASRRMGALIEDLLQLTRVTTRPKPFVTVSLAEIVAEVQGDLEIKLHESEGKIEVGELPELEADPVQMRQLFQNLIANSLKYRQKDVPPVVRISWKKDTGDRQHHVLVRDNGIGFDPKYSEKIFNIFHRLHANGEYEGTGIGLAICRKVVERHGGTITADSRPGEGASFEIALPVHQGKPGVKK